MPIDKPKRMVTGLREDGVSYFARVEEVDEVDYGAAYPHLDAKPEERMTRVHRIWGLDSLPVQLPQDGLTPGFDPAPTPEETPDAIRRSSSQPPATGGLRMQLVKFMPGKPGQPVPEPRQHWHNTFSIHWLIEGELVASTDDGHEEVLRPGDVIIHYGTSHAWENRGDIPAVLAVIITAAQRVGRTPVTFEQTGRPEHLAKH